MPIDVRDLTPTQTPLAKSRPYVCSICGSSFSNQAGLTAHMGRVHGEAAPPPSPAKPQTQAELWGATPPPKAPPTDIPLWQKGLDWLFALPTATGMAFREMERAWERVPKQGAFEGASQYRERLESLDIDPSDPQVQADIRAGAGYPSLTKEYLPGGELHEEFRELPWLQQLKYEAPFWGAMTIAPGALQARAALAPAAAAPGLARVIPTAARTALAPLAGAEKLLGVGLKYGIGLPLKYGVAKPLVAGARKSLELALDTGLDKWLIRQGIRGDQANKVIRFFLEKNNRWLYQTAEANWLRRLAEKKGMAETATRAASDTIIEAEPLLLRAAKDVGIKAPTVAKPIPELPIVKAKPIDINTRAIQILEKRNLLTTVDRELLKTRTVSDIIKEQEAFIARKPISLMEVAQQTAARQNLPLWQEVLQQATKEVKDIGVKPKPIPELPVGITAKPTIPVEVPMPAGVTYMAAEAPISVAQTTQITQLATGKALISEFGKVKPQLRQLITVFTGKAKIADLTQAEADNVIEALERLPDAVYRAGILVPPSIPRTTEVVPENFFNLKFERPTPIKYFTSQTYYAQQLGVKPLVEPLELAKQRFDLEYNALRNTIAAKTQEINKIARVPLAERAVAKAKNVPTKAVARMRDLLDKYEDAPEFLSAGEAKLFGWFRNLNRTMLNGENEVRRLLGMPEIPYRQAYVRHVAEGLAYEILAGKYPVPEGLKYWSAQITGKKVYNPMEMARKLAVDLEEYFTKDLEYATRSMVYTALKEIHLSQPLSTFTRQLSALSKDLPIYKHLSAEELAALRGIEAMPAPTKKWVIDYVNQVIKGQPTGLDEAVNRMLINRGLAGVFNKFLAPFGRSLGSMPITKLARLHGRGVIAGAMGWRPKQLIRNKFQWTQNLALYGIKANLKAIFPPSGTLRELLDESLFLKGYTGMEELPVDIQAKLERIWLAPYQWTAKTNAMDGMKAAYWDYKELITKPKYRDLGWADPKRTYTEPKDFLYPGERAKLLKEMEFGAGCTQYQYIAMGMPEIFRHKVLTPFTRLQSWWMNYFLKFHREAITRAFTGKTSYGARLPWGKRLNWFKYLILGGAILIPMGYKMSYLWGVLPSRFAPTAQFVTAMYKYAIADTEYQKTAALRQAFNSWQIMVPGALAFKDFKAVFTGERPIESLFFYATEESIWYKPEWAKEEEPVGPPPRQFPGGGGPSPRELPERKFTILPPQEYAQQIENAIWAQYPPQFKKMADQIKELEKTDPAAARKLQFQYPQILAIRRQIALQQGQLKRQEAMRERQELLQGK